jgi:hypothetical protein
MDAIKLPLVLSFFFDQKIKSFLLSQYNFIMVYIFLKDFSNYVILLMEFEIYPLK